MLIAKRLMLLLSLCALIGCSAYKVTTVPSQSPQVFYTVETYRGRGPVDNDFTRVYAHFQGPEKTSKQLVMDGEYLENSKITWNAPDDVVICIPDGITSTFRNLVTLQTGKLTAINIHNHLRENCQ